jgi:prevent-host-death family protein
MQVWPIKEVKAKLTKFVNAAKNEPQIISRKGSLEVIVMSMEKYNQLVRGHKDIVSFFQSSPLFDAGLKIERDKSPTRT